MRGLDPRIHRSPEVADIFRDHEAAWRHANAGHVSPDQRTSTGTRCVFTRPMRENGGTFMSAAEQ
jgi:hypothetical protein